MTVSDENAKNEVNAETIPTRASLLSRIKNSEDHDGWKRFFDTYSQLIYNTAVKAGLTRAEAQDAVQETFVSAMKSMPKFNYDPAKGSFKSWLMQLTSWRITDQLRKRRHDAGRVHQPDDSPASTDTIGGMADPHPPQLETIWNDEWESNLWGAATERVKSMVNPKHYQIFDLYVRQQKSVWEIAKMLKVNAGQVYLAKHRVGGLIKKEITRLRQQLI